MGITLVERMTVLIEENGPNAVVTSRALRDVPCIKGRISRDMRGNCLRATTLCR